MREDLTAFLREAASRELAYGTFDCGLWLADWYMRATGRPDPAAHLRGVGRRDVGNQLRVLVRAHGLRRVDTPIAGDIGLISLERHHCVGAIAIMGGNWVVIAEGGGLSVVRAERSIVWRVE